MNLKGILFDFDGTLVDSEKIHFELWNKSVAPYGVQISKSVYRDYMLGKSNHQNALDIVNLYAVDLTPDELIINKEQLFDAYIKESVLPLMNMAAEAIALCQRKSLALALVTGSGRGGVIRTLSAHNLIDEFSCIVTKMMFCMVSLHRNLIKNL